MPAKRNSAHRYLRNHRPNQTRGILRYMKGIVHTTIAETRAKKVLEVAWLYGVHQIIVCRSP